MITHFAPYYAHRQTRMFILMEDDDLENRDSLSANVILGNATPDEIQIFNQLVDEWNKEFGRNSSDLS